MVKVAFQGEWGAFSDIAAKKYFNSKITTVPSFSFFEAFEKLKKHSVDFIVVPVENSLYGSVYETYDLLLEHSFKIHAELNLQINHCLIANKNYKLKDILKIYSHPQALGQCSSFLNKLKNVEITPSYDTAGSAILLSKSKSEPAAAIASKEATKIYKLKILRKDIQNNKENFTRFLVVSRKTNNTNIEHPKTSICFELKSIPGALYRALSVFALRDIDLVKIESRPIPYKPFRYTFYADLIGNLKEKKIKLALNHLSEISISIKKFGSYEIGKTFKS
jgi:prephenate dehydratase